MTITEAIQLVQTRKADADAAQAKYDAAVAVLIDKINAVTADAGGESGE
jgi:hypothetical protein